MIGNMNQRGFAALEAIMVVAVVVILAGIGILAYANLAGDKHVGESHTDAGGNHMNMPSISSADDLDTAAKSLDDTSFDDDGLAEIDSESANF